MKALQHRFPILLLLTGMAIASTAQAALVAKLGGTVVYDTDRNITWLADANYAKTSGYNATGFMTWNQANTWAASLDIGGVTGWRLPTALNADGSGPCSAFNCTGSELGNMFYGDINHGLGGVAGQSILTTHNANFNNLFSNIQSYVYWSGTEYAPVPNAAWDFGTDVGYQGYRHKGSSYYGWAVHSGDVAAVPEPEEYMMMLLGFGMVGYQIKRKQRKAASAK
jgi:hypothetical protein